MVALGTICMEGLVRVEDHLKGKDAEKQEGPMELGASEKSPSRLTRKDLKMLLCFAGCCGNTEAG